MDPNSNLKEQREIIARILSRVARADETTGALKADDTNDQLDDVERLADLAQALDEWIGKGGFLPAAWQLAQKRAT